MELARPLLDLFCPRACAGCGASVGAESGHICWDCRASITLVQAPFCDRCGDPVAGAVTHAYECALCGQQAPRFDRARSAARYDGPLLKILQDFKYNKATWLGRDLGEFLQACVQTHYPRLHADAVTFVPLSPRKQRERTYNQSQLLAGDLARRLGLPLLARALRRVRYTATQTHLTTAERAANVRGAFAAVHPDWLEGRTLLLVDDVMTTGATVRECARVLKEAGAARVFVVTVARG